MTADCVRSPRRGALGHFCAALLATLAASALPAQDGVESTPATLPELMERFQSQRELLAEPVEELNRLYEGQLTALREKVKEAGDLDKLLVVDTELKAFRDEDYEGEGSFPEIARLRQIYRSELSKRRNTLAQSLGPFVSNYLEQLDELSRELTRQDKVREALAVREESERARGILAASPTPSKGGDSSSAALPASGGGRLGGLGFGTRPDPAGSTPRGLTDVVSIKYWERDRFDAGWVALRANGTVLTDKDRRVSDTRDRIVAIDASAAGIVMVRDDGTLDSSLCLFAPPEDRAEEFTEIAEVALGRVETSVGPESAVAVKRDGSLVWWGPATNAPGVEGPPREARENVASIASGRGVYTVVKTNGKVVSWRFEGGDGRIALPEAIENARFQQVVTSEQHSLGLKTNGDVVAWGQNSVGQTDVPRDLGKCSEVAVLHNVASLARKTDGTWVAWGRDYGDIRDQINGSSKRRNIVGRLFPPSEYAYAVWIEEE